jgi:hypothetical protein
VKDLYDLSGDRHFEAGGGVNLGILSHYSFGINKDAHQVLSAELTTTTLRTKIRRVTVVASSGDWTTRLMGTTNVYKDYDCY